MELSHMLHQMCHEALSAADIGAIRKARGFKEQETASRTTFENFFLSSIGIEAVMAALTPEETATLHLLSQQKSEVRIAFFERLYGKKETGYYSRTFTQKYKETFDAVKKSLVRRGILIMAEANQSGDSVQMERWRFRMPPEFAAYLPPIIQAPHRSEAPGETHAEVIRRKLNEALGGPTVLAWTAKGHFSVSLVAGALLMGGQPFRAAALAEWQQETWLASLEIEKPSSAYSQPDSFPAPPAAVMHFLGTLREQEWAAPAQLEAALKVFCFGGKFPSTALICENGWQWGCLARLVENGRTFYRLPSQAAAPLPDLEPGSYLRLHPSGNSALVDLRTIPLEMLEQLNRLAHLEAQYNNLIASPDRVKLGRAAPEDRQSPLASWLHAHSPTFRQALDSVAERWGKTILHSGLLVARVRDLSLRVQLERELGKHLVVLNDEFVAFPRAWRSEVEKVLKKGGFVIKEVRA